MVPASLLENRLKFFISFSHWRIFSDIIISWLSAAACKVSFRKIVEITRTIAKVTPQQ